MITVKYQNQWWELVVTKHNRLIMRSVEDKGYWLPIENSLENRLHNLKIKVVKSKKEKV